jgi:integrase/recombinase XerD
MGQGEKVIPSTEQKIKNYLAAFRFELERRGKSGATVRNYTGCVRQMFNLLNEIKITGATSRERFLSLAVAWISRLQWRKDEVAAKTINLHINAIRSFASLVLGFIITDRELPRMKEPYKLPEPFSREEIQKIFSVENNRKHLLLLQLAYHGGLRLGDIQWLRVRNLRYDTGLVQVKSGKGEKDRHAPMPDYLHTALKEFTQGKGENDFVFTPQGSKDQYPKRTIQKICENACIRAGIYGRHNIHRLRHSFGSHMVQAGVNLRIIQESLGHKSSKTTELYTRVASCDISNVRNALAMKNKVS